MEKQDEGLCIGVLDSGMGGLTVVRELERLLPSESVVYFGDSANCPYGNRSREEILKLSLSMLDFLQRRGIKIAAIACNTISVLIEELRKHYDFPIVSIIEAACEYTAGQKLGEVGIFATEFTIQQKLYNTLITSLNPGTKVYGQPSRTLAGLVDQGRFDDPAMDAEVRSLLNLLLTAHPELKHIVLGCTHYPIVTDLFQRAAPDINFINPAMEQAKAVQKILETRGALARDSQAKYDIFTSGDTELYAETMKRLKILSPVTLHSEKIA